MREKQGCYRELMEAVDDEVLENSLIGLITDAAFPDGNGFGDTDEQASTPPAQQQC